MSHFQLEMKDYSVYLSLAFVPSILALLAFVSSQRGINGRLNEGHTYIDNIASYDHDTAANITCHTTK